MRQLVGKLRNQLVEVPKPKVDLQAGASGGWFCSWPRQGSGAFLLSGDCSGLSLLSD